MGAAVGAGASLDVPDIVFSRMIARDVGILALVSFACAAGMAVADIWNPSALEGWIEWSVALCVIAVSATLFQFTRLAAIWKTHLARKDEAPEAANLGELFAYLVLTHATLASVVFLSTRPGAFGVNEVSLSHTEETPPDLIHVGIVVALFALSFLPLAATFLLQALQGVRSRGQKLLRDDVVSPLSLFVILSIFGGIALLAWAAAGRMFTMTNDFGVLVTIFVVIAFIATILAPHCARYWNERSEARADLIGAMQKAAVMPIPRPAKWVSFADSILVRLVAPFSGATQKRFPHLVLIAVMLPLSALGFALATPFGLIPIALGMLIVLALGRRWAWLEDDRETASRLQSTTGNEIHIGFENDLKDEALLGYAWLFILVPLALNQLQEWTHSFTTVEGAGSGNPFVDWMRFFGAELAKAVPFVDWWEIYNVDVQTPFDAKNAAPLAKHLTFVSRALVDLVIMAALFQALSIWQRSRTQQRLYDGGQLDYFDPFTEVAFFETGMHIGKDQKGVPKKKFEQRVKAHAEARKALGRPPMPYSSQRLAELLKSRNADVRAGAQWMTEEFGVLTGSARDQLAMLDTRWIRFNLVELAVRTRNGDAVAHEQIRGEKIEFERILFELGRVAKDLTADDVGKLYGRLETVRQAPEFAYARQLAYGLLRDIASIEALSVLAMCVLDVRHHQAQPEWRKAATTFFGRAPTVYERRAEARIQVYEALDGIGCNPEAPREVRECALRLLMWMATAPPADIPVQNDGAAGDAANEARVKARALSNRVSRSLPKPT